MEKANAMTRKTEVEDAAVAPLTDVMQADNDVEAPVNADQNRRVRCPSPSPTSPAPTRDTDAIASSSSSATSEALLDSMMDNDDLGSYNHEPAAVSPDGGTAAAVAWALAARTAGFGRADEDLNKEEPRKKKEKQEKKGKQETEKGTRHQVR